MSLFTTENQPDPEVLSTHRQIQVEARRDSILRLHERGLVPLAIASKLRLSLSYVSSVLRSEGVGIPSFLETQGPRPENEFCPHCGRRL